MPVENSLEGGAAPVRSLSVIVCTRDRGSRIAGTLESIRQAHAYAQRVLGDFTMEFLAIDNGSKDDTVARIEAFAKGVSFPVRVIEEPRPGLSAARNAALLAASGDILAFTDDDCQFQDDYFERLLSFDLTETAPSLIGGRVELGSPDDLPFTILTETDVHRYVRGEGALKRHLGGVLLGCNMAMRREVADQIGVFDERFGAGGPLKAAEDSDYIFRAYGASIPITYNPALVVNHFHGRRQMSDVLKLIQNYDQGEGAIYAKYLFRDIRMVKQFYWDVRSMVFEALGRRDGELRFGVSYRQKVYHNIIGFFRYLRLPSHPPVRPQVGEAP